MKRPIILTLSLALILSFFLSPEHAGAKQSWAWILLGQREINYDLNEDFIDLGARSGFYRRLQLKVANGNLLIDRLELRYRNGMTEEIELRHHFRPGDDVLVINLQGQRRILDHITVFYETDGYPADRTMLYIFGNR